MILTDAVDYLERNGVDPGYYALGDLGGGEIWGIERLPSGWQVYYSERGAKRNPKIFDNESDAVRFFLIQVARTLKQYEDRELQLPV